MGKAFLKWKFQSMGLKYCISHRDQLIQESIRRFEVRTDKRFQYYPDFDYYGIYHSEEFCSLNSFSNRCEGEDLHKKVHKDTFLLNFYDDYRKRVPSYFDMLIEVFEKNDKAEQVKVNVIEKNDMEI